MALPSVNRTATIVTPTSTVHVALSGDNRVAMNAAVVLFGIAKHLRPGVALRVHFLHLRLGPKEQQQLSNVFNRLTSNRPDSNLTFHSITAQDVASLPDVRHLPVEAYLRLFLPQVLPDVRRIIYVDTDLIVNADLCELWELQLNNCLVAAVTDYYCPSPADKSHLAFWEGARSLPSDLEYFNSGVLLIDLDGWRSETIGERCLHFCRDYNSQLNNADQDALNAVIQTRRLTLSYKWNIMEGDRNRLEYLDSAAKREVTALLDSRWTAAGIYHFVGRHKPWGRTGCTQPVSRMYLRLIRQSGWFSAPELAAWTVSWLGKNLAARFARR
jgi:lipopolysaccharide biosynthesis glycosyltransferase